VAGFDFGILEEIGKYLFDLFLSFFGRCTGAEEIDLADPFGIVDQLGVFIEQLKDKSFVLDIRVDTGSAESMQDSAFFGKAPIGIS